MMKKNRPGWIYLLQAKSDDTAQQWLNEDIGLYKIGRTVNLDVRVKNLRIVFPYRLSIAYAYHVPDCVTEESALHDYFASKRLRGEWFRLALDDVGLICEIADYRGIYEASNGRMIRDFQADNYPGEVRARMAVIEALERDYDLARNCSYLPHSTRTEAMEDLLDAAETWLEMTDARLYLEELDRLNRPATEHCYG